MDGVNRELDELLAKAKANNGFSFVMEKGRVERFGFLLFPRVSAPWHLMRDARYFYSTIID